MKSIAIFLLFVAVAHSGKVCRHNSDCPSRDCCQILAERMIVSKRANDFFSGASPNGERTGTCEPYKKKGDKCYIFDKANGYCDCKPGTKCVGKQVKVQANNAHTMFRRKLAAAKPGYKWEYLCREPERIDPRRE